MDAKRLLAVYGKAHDIMRNVDGLQPQESFDELLKFLFFKEMSEAADRQDLRGELILGDNGAFLPK